MRLILSERGDTIVEVAIALAILSGIIVGVFAAAIGSYRLSISSRQHSEGTILIQQQFEQLEGLRNSYFPQGNPGWDTFRGQVFGNTITHPTCGVAATSIHLENLSRNDATHSDSWSIQTGSGTKSTSNADFTLNVNACYMAAIDTERIRFDATADWTGPGGSIQHAEATYVLADVNDIRQQSFDGAILLALAERGGQI